MVVVELSRLSGRTSTRSRKTQSVPSERRSSNRMVDCSDLGSVLVGSNSPASLHAIPSSTSAPVPALSAPTTTDLVCRTTQVHNAQDSGIFVFQFVLHSSEYRLRSDAPPPKLHYSTFWRSITRRMYNQHSSIVIAEARKQSLKWLDTSKMLNSDKDS